MSPIATARLFLVAAIATTVIVGCGSSPAASPLQGDGALKTQSRTVTPFTEIDVRHGIELRLVVGAPLSLEITAQANLLDLVTVSQSGETLVLDATRDYASATGIVVRVAAPAINGVVLQGGAHGAADGIDAGGFAINVDGGSLTASGSAERLTLTAKGGGVVDLADLTATSVTVDLAGGIKARVCATSAISGSAVGGVVLTVRGKPATATVEASGGALVNEE